MLAIKLLKLNKMNDFKQEEDGHSSFLDTNEQLDDTFLDDEDNSKWNVLH